MSDSRNNLRTKLLATKKRKFIVITLFDEEIEFRQPTVKEVMSIQDTDSKEVIARVLINQAFVPGTEERIFEESDLDTILDFPAGGWVTTLTDAMSQLSDLEVGTQAKKSKATALPEASTT